MSNTPRSMSTNGFSKIYGPANINIKKEVEKMQPRKKNIRGFATLFFVDSVRPHCFLKVWNRQMPALWSRVMYM
jgi:hypothetical protein